jgi:hypothetical protein
LNNNNTDERRLTALIGTDEGAENQRTITNLKRKLITSLLDLILNIIFIYNIKLIIK